MGARYLTSGLLSEIGVPHAFTVRMGGVSTGMFGSLNFGNPGDLEAERRDPPANIRENLRLVLGDLACPEREVVEVHQVHGGEVHEVVRGQRAHAGGHDTRADAIVSNDPARMLAVRVADCAPVLLASVDGGIVAAAHAGWRGVIAGVAVRAAERMRKLGAKEIVGAVGPCISAAHFEVGPEVMAEFERAFPGAGVARRRGDGKGNVDLKEALRLQLEREGVRCEILPHCTYGDARLFFSHRREKGMTGRMMGLIGAGGDGGAGRTRGAG